MMFSFGWILLGMVSAVRFTNRLVENIDLHDQSVQRIDCTERMNVVHG
jgi:hypothetical protein